MMRRAHISDPDLELIEESCRRLTNLYRNDAARQGNPQHGGEYPSQWAAIRSIASKIGCTAEALRRWVRQAERDRGERAGLSTPERECFKELERENRELKRANEILRTASAYFAKAELDRRRK
jgi:transposase